MKIKGVDLGKPYIEFVVIPRGEGAIVFQAQAVLEYSEFHELCPRPVPRDGMRKDPVTGNTVAFKDTTDKRYQEQLGDWATKQVSWMILKSLEATEGLEWDTVVANDPATWGNYAAELKASNFSDSEIDRIVNGVMIVCGLNESKITEATKSFLAGRAAQDSVKSTPSTEQVSTLSGEPANVLA